MKNKSEIAQGNGFIVFCNLEGQIEQIVYDDLIIESLQTDSLLPRLVDENSFQKAVKFITLLKEEKALFDWELNLVIDGEVVPLNFSGLLTGDKLLILATDKVVDSLDYYEEIVKMNNEHLNKFRRLLKDKLEVVTPKQTRSGTMPKLSQEEQNSYQRLTELNNQFANLQRKLARKNKELTAQRKKFQITLESIADGVFTTDQEGIINFVNPAAMRMLNRGEEDIVGKHYSEVFQVVDDLTETPIKLDLETKLAQGQTVKKAEAELVVEADFSLPVGYKASPINNDQGEFVGAVLVFRDIFERKKSRSKLEEQAAEDMLTGVFNRRKGLAYLKKQIQYTERISSHLSVCFVDVDDLKVVNDTYGHQVGDQLLEEVAQVLYQNIRSSDAVARLGGDEFLLILSETTPKEAEITWERIEERFSEINLQGDNPYRISVSYGIVEWTADCNLSGEKLIDKADQKMYQHKQAKKS